MASGLTKLEQEYLDKKRNGESVEAVTKPVPGGGELVSLTDAVVSPPTEDTVEKPKPAMLKSLGDLSLGDINKMVGADAPTAERKIPEPEAPEVKEEDPQEQEMISAPAQANCPNCGWDLAQPVDAEVTDEDREEFIKAVLGGRRFERKVDMLDGQLSVIYHTPLVEEEDAILEQMRRDEEAGTVPVPAAWMHNLRRYRLLFMLKVTVTGEQAVTNPGIYIHRDADPDDKPGRDVYSELAIKDAERRIIKPMTGYKLNLLIQGMNLVDSVYSQLMARAQSPDFWGSSDKSAT